MNNYVTYTFYKETYGGSKIATETEFNKLCGKASAKVRDAILNRDISDYLEPIEYATCSITDLFYDQEKLEDRIKAIALGDTSRISSEKIGDYSRNIENMPIDKLEELISDSEMQSEINSTLNQYLGYTGLLYRGIKYV
jgi:hypothetical protein